MALLQGVAYDGWMHITTTFLISAAVVIVVHFIKGLGEGWEAENRRRSSRRLQHTVGPGYSTGDGEWIYEIPYRGHDARVISPE